MTDKKKPGRPVEKLAEPIPATPKEIATALFKSADRKFKNRKRPS